MLFLYTLRTTQKFLIIVRMLNAIAIAVGVFSIKSLTEVSEAAQLVASVLQFSVVSARVNQNVVGLNRIEMMIASNPDSQLIAELHADAEREEQLLKERMASIRTSPASEVHPRVRLKTVGSI